MNILFLSGYNVDPIAGGISRITKTLADAFAERGHNVWYLGYRKISFDDPDRQLYFPYSQPVEKRGNREYLEHVIETKRIDIVIVQKSPCVQYMSMLSLCKKKYGIKVITCFHNLILTPIYNYAYGVEYSLKKNRKTFVFKLLKKKVVNKLLSFFYILKHRPEYRYLVNESDISVVLSNGQKDELLTMIGKVDDNSITVIPNCVCEQDVNLVTKKKEVLWVGNVDCSVKRIDTMIDIWQRIAKLHPDWKLRILGDGSSLEEMKNRTKKESIENVYFEGRVNPNAYYDSAKILCVTSVHESFSLVTIEAKMHGVVPIVQDNFPIAKEIVTNRVDGILTKSFCIEDFCTNLDELMSNEELCKSYSSEAKANSGRFSPENISKKWEEILFNTSRI